MVGGKRGGTGPSGGLRRLKLSLELLTEQGLQRGQPRFFGTRAEKQPREFAVQAMQLIHLLEAGETQFARAT
jgi:hypothetical protein